MQSTIYSIGHGNKTIEDFIVELKTYNIEFLIDVRTTPYSKWNPHFNQDDLKFINSMPVPMYKIINVISVVGDTGIDKISEFIALQEIDGLVRKLTSEMIRYLVAYKREKATDVLNDDDQKKVDHLISTARKNRKNINDIMVKAASDFNKQVNLVNYYKNLEKNIRQKSPIWTTTNLGG